MMEPYDAKKIEDVFTSATTEERAAFHKACSGSPEDISDSELDELSPIIARLKETLSGVKAPVRTGMPSRRIVLQGYLIPHQGVTQDDSSSGTMVTMTTLMLGFAGSSAKFLPVFSCFEALEALMHKAGIPFSGVNQIDDEKGFLRGIPSSINGYPVKIIVDPTITEGGHVRYCEVLRD
jgi:hypothetical protein